MKPQALEVFKIFERTHGERGAKVIVEYLENADTMAIEREINNKIEHLATKDDLFVLRGDLFATREELNGKIAGVREDLTREIGSVRTEIGKTKAELMKWMFFFWVSQMAAAISIIMLFLKK